MSASGEPISNPPPTVVFSYAQAAKGQSKSASSSIKASSPSGAVTPREPPTPTTVNPLALNGASDAPSSSSIENAVSNSRPIENKTDQHSEGATATEDLLNASSPASSQDPFLKPQNTPLPPSPNVIATPNLNEHNMTSSIISASASFPEDHTLPSSTAEEIAISMERKTEKSVENEPKVTAQEVEEPAKKEKPEKKLVPAPIPAVNFWQLRAMQARGNKNISNNKSNNLTLNTTADQSPQVNATASGTGMNPVKTAPLIVSTPSVPPISTQNDSTESLMNGQASMKSIRKGAEGTLDRDDVFKKPPPRNKTIGDKIYDQSSSIGPLSVADTTLWPSPETAQDQEKKLAQERGSKGDKERSPATATQKPQKEKWIPLEHVPNVIFNTALPPKRGGRNTRGTGRGTHTTNGSISGERNAIAPRTTTGSAEGSDRGRQEASSARAASLPPKPAKRASSMGVREPRRNITGGIDKRKEDDSISVRDVDFKEGNGPVAGRRPSAAAQTEHRYRVGGHERYNHRYENNQTTAPSNFGDEKYDTRQTGNADAHVHPRSATSDRRRESFISNSEYSRDSAHFGHQHSRGGGERGRGNHHSSRGGHNGFGAQSFNSSHPQSFSSNSSSRKTGPPPFSPTKSSTYSYGQSQGQATPYDGQRGGRSYRDQSRTQSIPTTAAYGAFPRGGPYAGPQAIPPIQTGMNPYADYPPHPASAGPYAQYADQLTVVNMVTLQLDYYFSLDNMCKDLFLRKHMDSQGFVFLSVIANFNRIKQLTQDIDVLRYAASQTKNVEFRPGRDGIDRLRQREGWEQFVLDMSERDESARNEGPPATTSSPIPFPMGPESFIYQDRSLASPSDFQHMDQGYQPYGMMPHYSMNASLPDSNIPNMANGTSGYVETPLSAAVPDFSPAIPPVNGNILPSLDSQKYPEDKFTDEQLDSLRVVVRQRGPKFGINAPFQSASRTFSNGSIEANSGRAGENMVENSQSQPLANGGSSNKENFNSEPSKATSTPLLVASTSHALPTSPSPSVLWIKDRAIDPLDVPEGSTIEDYNTFHYNTLRERQTSSEQDVANMTVLFEFWSHFLVRNFNTRLYQEFRDLAFHDALHRNSQTGMKNLIEFYDNSMTHSDVMSDIIALHYVELVKNEDPGSDRPAFNRMRAAWRNGALNMKTRKKIDNFAGKALKEELER